MQVEIKSSSVNLWATIARNAITDTVTFAKMDNARCLDDSVKRLQMAVKQLVKEAKHNEKEK